MLDDKKRKKILLVSNGFYPEISPRSFRATELAKEFSRQGHDVTVFSKFRVFDYSELLNEFSLRLIMWTKPIFPQIPIIGMTPFNIICRGISRLLSIFFEYPTIEEMFKVKRILKKQQDFDIMISFAVPYPVHWGVAWAASLDRRIASTWIADCGDPFMGNTLDSFRKPFYFKYLEKWFCRKADFISIPLETAKSGYYPEFHHKIRIIPQGFDFVIDEVDNSDPENNVPTFLYAGGFLPGARDPEPFLKFLAQLHIPFKFFIYTKKSDLLNGYKVQMKDKLFVSDYIPRADLVEIMKGMDFLINFDNNTPLNSPSKLIDYAIAKRPVLNITKSFIAEDLLAFLNKDYKSRMPLPDPKQYHISRISGLFLELDSQ